MDSILKLEPKMRYDLSHIAWEAGFPFNNVGNFSLLPLPQGNGYFAYVRAFGYWIDGNGRYLTNDRVLLKHPRLHLFVLLDKNFNFVRRFHNTESQYFKLKQYPDEAWLEDGRLVVWNGKVYLSTTVCYQKDGRWNAAGLEIQRLDFQQDAVRATHFWNTIEKGVAGIQKNWLPVPDKPLHYIVGTSRSGAQHIDISTGEVFDVGEIDKKVIYRGTTPLVAVDGGYVASPHVDGMDA